MLPVYLSQYPFYDRTLPRVCHFLKKIDKHLTVIDIGANIGDTVSLITEKTSGTFLCVEGDKKFLPILKKNIKKFKNNHIYIEESYCSNKNNTYNSFNIERKFGTAKITISKSSDKNIAQEKTLDTILLKYPELQNSNLLKIDTDGFELNILQGAKKTLAKIQPVLYFEFTPDAYINNKQDPYEIFRMLLKFGYKTALFYDNFGIPNKVVDISNTKLISALIDKIDNHKIYYYDILIYPTSKSYYHSIYQEELISCIDFFNEKYILPDEYASLKIQIVNLKKDLNFASSSLSWNFSNFTYLFAKKMIPAKIFDSKAYQKLQSLLNKPH